MSKQNLHIFGISVGATFLISGLYAKGFERGFHLTSSSFHHVGTVCKKFKNYDVRLAFADI